MNARVRTMCLLLAALLAIPAGAASASNDAGSGDARQAARKTTIVIKVVGCRGVCKVSPAQLRDYDEPAWFGKTKRVRRGKVTLRVPTSRTKGMSFEVESSRRTFTEYRVFTALRYAGKKTGSKVSVRRAARAKKGSGCWAGTSKRRKALTFRVRYLPRASSYSGAQAKDMRVWSTRTLRSTPRSWQETSDGTIGSQDPPLIC